MRNFILILMGAVLLSACGPKAIMYNTRVTSDPPGARIELNNDYMGTTPLTLDWLGYTNNRFVNSYVVKAFPTHPGDYVQEKTFKGTRPGVYWGDEIPKHIFFDMNISTSLEKKANPGGSGQESEDTPGIQN